MLDLWISCYTHSTKLVRIVVKKVLFVARLKRAYITKMQSYPIHTLASIVFLVNGLLGANNGFQSDMYTSSGELINAFRMEQELVRSLKDIQLQNFNHLIN